MMFSISEVLASFTAISSGPGSGVMPFRTSTAAIVHGLSEPCWRLSVRRTR